MFSIRQKFDKQTKTIQKEVKAGFHFPKPNEKLLEVTKKKSLGYT